MIPVFVVVILAILLGFTAIAIIIVSVESKNRIKSLNKDLEAERLITSSRTTSNGWMYGTHVQTYDALAAENKDYMKVLGALRELLPNQYKLLSRTWNGGYGDVSEWNYSLIMDLVKRKGDLEQDAATDKILKKLGVQDK